MFRGNHNFSRLLAVLPMAILWMRADSCCVVARRGLEVKIGAQQDIIVWDPATQTEHFIRRAHFMGKANDLGFIAPTPSVPELVEVDGQVFEVANEVLKDYNEAKEREPSFGCGAKAEDKGASNVEVIKVQEVAGYLATTLRSTDPVALHRWLTENHYETNKSIDDWLSFYTRKQWYLTAFKVALGNGTRQTGLVRMTFKTEKPYCPYFVPATNIAPSKNQQDGLSIAFYDPGVFWTKPIRMDLATGQGAVPLLGRHVKSLKESLKLTNLRSDLALTVLYDYNFPSPTDDDLFFERVGDIPRWPTSPFWWVPYAAAVTIWIAGRKLQKRRRLAEHQNRINQIIAP